MNDLSNTLFLGNGFSRTVYSGTPSWEELLNTTGKLNRRITNTLRYECAYLVQKNSKNGMKMSEEDLKCELAKRLVYCSSEIIESVEGIDCFGTLMKKHDVNNIITTNYDNGIELILTEKCGYTEDENPEGLAKEDIYSIRTYRLFRSPDGSHQVKLWKIHGDAKRIKSMMLGFDHYCGSIEKLKSYIKGKYESEDPDVEPFEVRKMEEKCAVKKFDEISWAELFYRTNVHIVGFGMSYEEMDIWWMLNKRARLIDNVNNRIIYRINDSVDKKMRRDGRVKTLKIFGADIVPLDMSRYIDSIFDQI